MPVPPVLTRVAAGLLGLALLTGCSGSRVATTMTAESSPATSGAASPATALRAMTSPRLRPDVLVTGVLTAPEVRAVKRLASASVAYRTGTVQIGKTAVRVASVDPTTFRRYAAQGTAESTAVWQAVATGQLVASHALAKQLHLQLGSTVTLSRTVPLRLGALATTGIPGTDLVVDDATGTRLGLRGPTSVLLTAGKADPTTLASKVRRLAGGAAVELLTPPAANPMAFLTGSRAAKAFGAFSYTYFPDGTIVPDSRWVRASIVTATVPILGKVTCHRLMVPQLRGALAEVKKAGLAAKIHTYNGCYVPRFIERDPSHAISLHTWGIAIDLDSATNYRGIRGTMDPRVVTIFKRWGFRWGGDWTYSDPMHFELGALLR